MTLDKMASAIAGGVCGKLFCIPATFAASRETALMISEQPEGISRR
jgi:hypothetical protein